MKIHNSVTTPAGPERVDSDLRNDQAGASVTEFAAVLPFIAMLFAGSVEFSNGFGKQMDLEQAAQRAVELAVVRPPTANSTTELAHIRTEAESVSGEPTGNVTVELYRECNDVKQSTYGAACASGQRQADFVRVEIQGTYTRWIDWKKFDGRTSGSTPTMRGQASARVR
jgi:Flp pilus assembly protein TadG